MDDAPQTSAAGIEVSPEEERYLKRFFRRQIFPWVGALLMISITLSFAAGGGDTKAVEARTSAAVAQLRSENQELREEIEQLSARLQSGLVNQRRGTGNELERRVEDAEQSIRMIEARVTAKLERRLDGLEAQLSRGVSSAPGAVSASGVTPPPEAAAWDVSQILDRLYALEMVQQDGGSRAPSGPHLRRLEARLERLETTGAPAAPPAEIAP